MPNRDGTDQWEKEAYRKKNGKMQNTRRNGCKNRKFGNLGIGRGGRPRGGGKGNGLAAEEDEEIIKTKNENSILCVRKLY
jgi:hypothetical protein